jgi:long-chain acyl-CoA synthetase
VAGHKFFPDEVEQTIAAFPGIAEARVYARRHRYLGEVPCAEIVVGSNGCNMEALRSHCARLLSAHKVPVEFLVVDEIAKTPGGKVLRRNAEGV